MGTKAIFKVYEDGKFVFGSWVKYNGGVQDHSLVRKVMTNLRAKFSKLAFYQTINSYVSDSNFGFLQSGDKKKPFSTQINDDGMKECEVLFWDIPMSDKKLMENNVWGEYIYELRYTKNGLTFKVIYNGNTKTYKLTPDQYNIFSGGNIQAILMDLNKWVDEIEYGLNDCNCGEDEK